MTEDGSSPLLTVNDIAVTFRSRWRGGEEIRAVDGVSFTLAAGETLGVVGESGSGKSTLARCVMRLLAPARGRIEVDGLPWSALRGRALRAERHRVQMVFQDPYSSLDPTMTVHQLVAEPLGAQRRTGDRRAIVGGLLDRVSLGARFAERYPDQLSGGQRQRVAIARALAAEPQVVVCDEAVSALDVSTQNQVVNLLGHLQRDLGMAYLFIAHDLAVVRHLAHRVAVMYRGRIVEVGPTDAVFQAPRHPYTEALLAAILVPKPAVQRERRGRRAIAAAAVPAAAEQPSTSAGCAFSARCAYAFDRCAVEAPVLTMTGNHGTACHLAGSAESPALDGVWTPGRPAGRSV